MNRCPVCDSSQLTPILSRPSLPVMQNVVYPSRQEAVEAPCARFSLAMCTSCGFAFNSAFDAVLARYDERYDNEVPSAAYRLYYKNLATMLIRRLGLETGTVIDVGCGKGAFLNALCQVNPALHGVGIDPSCVPTSSGNVELIRDFFSPKYIRDDARVVLLRHVLEHLEEPREFLYSLRSFLGESVSLFVEVPDLGWILDQGAFWDFCYEHCNYFTLRTLKNTIESAGFKCTEQEVSFGGQYQWALCKAGKTVTFSGSEDGITRAKEYARQEQVRMDRARRLVANTRATILWGMGAKGVVFASLIGADQFLGGIDVNPLKQGQFAPGSGLKIHPPEWLRELGTDVTVLVMNPNYATEIEFQVRSLGSDANVLVV